MDGAYILASFMPLSVIKLMSRYLICLMSVISYSRQKKQARSGISQGGENPLRVHEAEIFRQEWPALAVKLSESPQIRV